jgi:hypothetical protein
MEELLEALEAAGYTYMQNVMEPDFDYPLDFFGRQEDEDVMVIGEIEEVTDGILVTLRPFGKFQEWLIKGGEEIPFFINSFDKTFTEFVQFIDENWIW